MRDQAQTLVVPSETGECDSDEAEPLVQSEDEDEDEQHQQQQPVPAAEMRAISFLGALRIPVSFWNGVCNVTRNEYPNCSSDLATETLPFLLFLLPTEADCVTTFGQVVIVTCTSSKSLLCYLISQTNQHSLIFLRLHFHILYSLYIYIYIYTLVLTVQCNSNGLDRICNNFLLGFIRREITWLSLLRASLGDHCLIS